MKTEFVKDEIVMIDEIKAKVIDVLFEDGEVYYEVLPIDFVGVSRVLKALELKKYKDDDIKHLVDESGENVKCGFCNKPITNKDEIEYSREHCEFYCCPDHATAQYYEYEGSKQIDFEDAQKNLKNEIYGWSVM